MPKNRKPNVEAYDLTKAPGTKIALSDLFKLSDKDDNIDSLKLKDDKGGGHLTRNGKTQAEGKTHTIDPEDLDDWVYVVGAGGSKDQVTLKAIDSVGASDSDTALIKAKSANSPPVVEAYDLTKAPGTKIALSDLFKLSDKDDNIDSLKLKDDKGGGHLTRNGKTQAEGKTHTIDPEDLDDWVYVVGASGSKDQVTLKAIDSVGASDSDTAAVVARSATGSGAIELMSPVAGSAAWKVGQAPGGAFSHNGDLYYGWDLSLANGADEFGFGVYAVADGVVKWIVEYVADGNPSPKGKDFSYGPSGSLGNIVTIEHNVDGVLFYSSYLHLKQNSVIVSMNQEVEAGQRIAEIGNTGVREGTHLHLNLGFTYGSYTNSAGNSFDAYKIAEGPSGTDLLSKFDFIDSPRSSKELQARDSFISTTPSSGASKSAAGGQGDGLPGIGGGDEPSYSGILETSHPEWDIGMDAQADFSGVSLRTFSEANIDLAPPSPSPELLGFTWDIP